MTEAVIIFDGSKRDFQSFITDKIEEYANTIPFMELIQHYNARLRPNESGVREDALYDNIEVDNCIVRADDYGSVLEHVLSNFVNIVNRNYNIRTLYVHNPPRRVRQSLESVYGNSIEYRSSEHKKITREILKF